MSTRRILTVGFELASNDTKYATLRDKMSLLDWDIVLFKPQISEFYGYPASTFQGKRSLGDSDSFQLKECSEHWRREIRQAFDAGKTVIVFLPALDSVYVDSGQRSYSGTGRNQRTTRHVTEYDNYQSIPAELAPVAATGTSMKLANASADLLSPYWTEFQTQSEYKVILTSPKVPAAIVTKVGDKPVGALYRSKTSSGALLLLPDIDFYARTFIKAKGEAWTSAATQFAGRMLSAVVELDKALRASSEVTPEPSWAAHDLFALGPERGLRTELLEAERQVEAAQKRKEALSEQLRSAGSFRALLFEKGKPLENAIIAALRLLGFTAHPFKDAISEFDMVFESAEGRLIGEAEGKDNKAINIEKLRQLAMNIHEDLQRDNVSTPAKPVLFGNGYRLQSLNERTDPFTEKCKTAAASSSTALVFTPDLFSIVQYLVEHTDEPYALACRKALLTVTGRVTFPPPPAPASPATETSAEKPK